MLSTFKVRAQTLLRRIGLAPAHDSLRPALPFWCEDMAQQQRLIAQRVEDQTGLTPALTPLCQGIAQLEQTQIPGAIVQCGSSQGGAPLMAAALALLFYENTRRPLLQFDNQACSRGTLDDDAMTLDLDRASEEADHVREALLQTRYPWEKLVLVAGSFLDTLADAAPRQIALLRLTTERFDSTSYALEQLYPRLAAGGILLLDGAHGKQGARRAAEAYLARVGEGESLLALEGAGWMVVKNSRASVLAA